jgi:hypothetical protein
MGRNGAVLAFGGGDLGDHYWLRLRTLDNHYLGGLRGLRRILSLALCLVILRWGRRRSRGLLVLFGRLVAIRTRHLLMFLRLGVLFWLSEASEVSPVIWPHLH